MRNLIRTLDPEWSNSFRTGLLRKTVLAAVLLTSTLALLPTSPVHAAFPGANGTIAFAAYRDGNEDIYGANADGSNPTRLTSNAGNVFHPAWSPDGSQIAFASRLDGNPEIYVMNTDGSNLIRLTSDAADDYDPTWSPDGSEIAFSSNRDGNDEIYAMNADGSNLIRLTSNTRRDSHPNWSPDGSKIAFDSDRDGVFYSDIYVMNADGSNPTRLTNEASFDYSPAWSPDGSKIAFESGRDGIYFQIYVMNADGSGQNNLGNSTIDDRLPAWSPDGSQITFLRGRCCVMDLFVMNANGSGQTLVTASVALSGPDWQPVAPANDAQNQALDVGQGQYPGVLALATPDGIANCPGNGQADIWYRFTAPMAGVLHTDTCGSNDLGGIDAGTDTVLSLHSGDGLTELGCNDDWTAAGAPACPAGSDAGSARDSAVQVSVVPDQQVLIRVTKYSSNDPADNILLNVAFDPDSDEDGVVDSSDNCTLVANTNQIDSDGDGYGNSCDGDLNNNGFTNAQDYVLFRAQLGQPSVAPTYNPADLNGNGFVNAQDAVLFRQLLGQPSGPSGRAWRVRLFNTDDTARAVLNGVEILACGYGQSCEVDFGPLLVPGNNSLRILVENTPGSGWTYGYEVTNDGVAFESDSCGTVGVLGCQNDDQTAGVVLDRTLSIPLP